LHEEAARVGDERQDDEDRVDGQAPSNEGRPGCKTVAAEETPSKSMEQGGQETMPEDITNIHFSLFFFFFSFFFLSLTTHVSERQR
jgi:hypothetical protein